MKHYYLTAEPYGLITMKGSDEGIQHGIDKLSPHFEKITRIDVFGYWIAKLKFYNLALKFEVK